MKNIISLQFILLVSLLPFYSCEKNYSYQRDQYIENKSGYDCTINLFLKDSLVKSIILLNNSLSPTLQTQYDEASGFIPFYDNEKHQIIVDSVFIKFIDKKHIEYFRSYSGRSIFNSQYYKEESSSENKFKYTYTIMLQDYQNAIPGK